MDQVGIGVELRSVRHAVMDLVGTLSLLENAEHDLHGQDLRDFVDEVKGRVEHQVPDDGGLEAKSVKDFLPGLTSKISSCFLKVAMTGSPSRKLARRLPAKQTTIDDSQQLSGCRRENVALLVPSSSRTVATI